MTPARSSHLPRALTVVFVLAAALAACSSPEREPEETTAMPTRPIEEVLADHAGELMAIEGVQGVYQGALDDGTPCLKVLVVIGKFHDSSRIPDRLEGYRVLLEPTDEIRPLGGTQD